MHILALDYGSKRIGLAWSDTTLGVVLPYGVIEKDSAKDKLAEVVALIRAERIDKIIVGFPLSLTGKENQNTQRIKEFVFKVQQSVDVPVEYYDERFSSQAADARGGGISRDEASAMIILEGYLERSKHK